MSTSKKSSLRTGRILAFGGLLALLAATGCQVDIGGQTLPSPYYLTDDIQYFPPGPEFKLSAEAATQRHQKAEAAAVDRPDGP